MSTPEDVIRSLGYVLPNATPKRLFVRVKLLGELAYVSGHGPTDCNGNIIGIGRVGTDVTVAEAVQAARIAAVNCLASLKSAINDLSRVAEVVKVLAFVNSGPEFHDQPLVADGFSSLLLDVFGESGSHVRSAVGVSGLPNNQCFEAEMLVRVMPPRA